MLMKPKVSIGVCVRNCEDFIKKTVESIIDADFPHELMELIVVDGHSKDETLAIIKENILKADIKCKIFHENEGLGVARQIVVDNASGDFIVWVDGDVILSKDYVRRQVEFMERNPAVGIAKGKYGIRNGTNLFATLENIGRKLKYVDRGYKGEARRSKPMATEGCIYRVEAVRQVGGFDEHIKGAGEDWDVEYRIRAAGWMLYITNVLFYSHGGKITWRKLWNKYFQFGYSLHYLLHKHRGIECLPTMLPPVAFLSGLFRSLTVYRLTHRKIVFLLPFHYTFKMTAWCLGFLNSHLDSHGHKAKQSYTR